MDTAISKATPTVKPATAISLTAARISLVSGATLVVLLTALHFVKPDLNPSWHVISEYALGDYGWIMTIAFLTWGLSAVSLFVAIRSQVQTLAGRIGLVFLLVGAASPILAAIFPTDPITTPPDAMTTSGAIHSTGGNAQRWHSDRCHDTHAEPGSQEPQLVAGPKAAYLGDRSGMGWGSGVYGIPGCSAPSKWRPAWPGRLNRVAEPFCGGRLHGMADDRGVVRYPGALQAGVGL